MPQGEPLPPAGKVQQPVQVQAPDLREALQEAQKQIMAQLLVLSYRQQEQIMIDVRGWTMDYRGFRYVYFWAAQQATVHLSALGQQVDLTLRAGDFTAVTAPPGAVITADAPVPVIAVWTNFLLVTQKIG